MLKNGLFSDIYDNSESSCSMNQECYFTLSRRKTSNFAESLLNNFKFHLQRNWPRFSSLTKFYRSSIHHVITIVKFSNRPIQNMFKLVWISVKWCKKLVEFVLDFEC